MAVGVSLAPQAPADPSLFDALTQRAFPPHTTTDTRGGSAVIRGGYTKLNHSSNETADLSLVSVVVGGGGTSAE